MVPVWNYIIEYTLHSLIIVVHIVALIFLGRSRCSNRYKNQMIIITCLCICELTGAAFFISYRIFECFISLLVANIILCFTLVFAVSIYYFIMVLLTLDRFLVFYLKFLFFSIQDIETDPCYCFSIFFDFHCVGYIDFNENNNVASSS